MLLEQTRGRSVPDLLHAGWQTCPQRLSVERVAVVLRTSAALGSK